MPKSNVKAQVLNTLSKYPENKGICIFVSPLDKYNEVNKEILNYLNISKKLTGVYVSLNKDYKEITSELEKIKINTSNLFFIIGIEKSRKIEADNCVYTQGPQALTELSLTITNIINTGKFDYIFFDSISTVLMYNNLGVSQKFSTYIINKLKQNDLLGIIISLNEVQSNKIIPTIAQLCDHCVNIS